MSQKSTPPASGSRLKVTYAVWHGATARSRRAERNVPRWGGCGPRGTNHALSGAPDPWAAVRQRLTPELRAACAVLLARQECQLYRGFPAQRSLLIYEILAEAGTGCAGSRPRARTLFNKLVALQILGPFDRRGETFEPPNPEMLSALLRDPPCRDTGALGRPVARRSHSRGG